MEGLPSAAVDDFCALQACRPPSSVAMTVVPAIVAGIEDVNVWGAAPARRLGPHGGTVGGRKGRPHGS
jgi:hypothetical protein